MIAVFLLQMNPAICNITHQTHCIGNSIFPHFVMVMTVLWAEALSIGKNQNRTFFCGDGQTSDVQTTREEYLSHSAWKGTGTTMGIAAVV
jgi:hypothetical protein